MTNYLATLRCAAGAVLLTLALGGCEKPPKPNEPIAPATDLPAAPADPATATPMPPAEAAEPAPAPAPDAPPPTEPSSVPKPTTGGGPDLESMKAAIPSAKMSVPVDLRYQFEAEPLTNQAVTLHLAAVPRVSGAKLQVMVKPADGLRLASGPTEVQKATATGIYRQQLSVTRLAAGPEKIRVLVTMEMPEGTGFGYFTVPLTTANPPEKQESVKQR